MDEKGSLQTGLYYSLTFRRRDGKYSIFDKDEHKIRVPFWEVPEKIRKGDRLNLFVFLDGREGLKATSAVPKAKLGELAYLELKELSDFGAFFDWGIKKDLFVPRHCLKGNLNPGDWALLYLLGDSDGRGVIGTCFYQDHLEEGSGELKVGQKVDLLVLGERELGFPVGINSTHKGLLYKNEVFRPLKRGDKIKGYIKKIRADGRVDVSLQPPGIRDGMAQGEELLLESLRKGGGFLPLQDKNNPEEIREALGMSKRSFKRAVGGLYRQGRLSLEEGGIRLLPCPQKRKP